LLTGLPAKVFSLFVQDTGLFCQKSEQKSAQEQMMTNPDLMSGMMKQNLFGIIPQVLPYGWLKDRHSKLVCYASATNG
jgi:hypothetical protein